MKMHVFYEETPLPSNLHFCKFVNKKLPSMNDYDYETGCFWCG